MVWQRSVAGRVQRHGGLLPVVGGGRAPQPRGSAAPRDRPRGKGGRDVRPDGGLDYLDWGAASDRALVTGGIEGNR